LAPDLAWGGKPVLQRYLGRANLSQQIAQAAASQGLHVVVASNRDILADLFYTERDAGLDIYAVPPRGRADNYYEQMRALPADMAGDVILVGPAPLGCAAALPPQALQGIGNWAGRDLTWTKLAAACLRQPG
jgi:hypothetical protein